MRTGIVKVTEWFTEKTGYIKADHHYIILNSVEQSEIDLRITNVGFRCVTGWCPNSPTGIAVVALTNIIKMTAFDHW